jgi:nucleotide-binding universal stress UspA family protein
MFSTIVVGVDGSSSSRQALRWAAEQALLHGAVLRPIMAWDYPAVSYLPLAMGVPPLDAMQQATNASLLDVVANELGDIEGLDVQPLAVWASPRKALVDHSGPGIMVVVGYQRHRLLGDLHLGSTVTSVIRDANSPVVVVPLSHDAHAASESLSASQREASMV